MTPKIDLAGGRFGRLTVQNRWVRAQTGKFWWDCICDCGAKKRVTGDRLRSGHTESCGCLRRESLIARNHSRLGTGGSYVRKSRAVPGKSRGAVPKHGGSGKNHLTWTAEYRAWVSMKTRCSSTYTERREYIYYYGRGIRICERWLSSFENFFSDVGPRPTPKHSIDRIDVDGNYEPNNVRWATAREQALNRRSSHSYRLRNDSSWIGG